MWFGSVDPGLVFARSLGWLGRDLCQVAVARTEQAGRVDAHWRRIEIVTATPEAPEQP